ncbi:hypothetical protein VOLCADRAFT_108153 [Volvox carteri f. nagariensis]|uniref:Uncharacterized protein n=1 Tax=Volvox carteri f. nagariensis TaxID=3068 RepID=D8UIK5_VOLCA|nr:uncharacterized protein VOLCADRAFT_108153 [Volvox carteri f. nagariensis]EFJ40410.1 hypothetical protein VOLCADRAFT_108153 [Volvox carteri f. nagariensis]|eukprot:XP_002958490.1 hypothetical protein VOLCADRAFT_108153 [Volvox carteri f. nagariensis]
MRESLSSGSAVNYLARIPGALTEAQLLANLGKAEQDLRKRQALDHLHNLRGKALEPLFYDFRSSLLLQLSASYKPLVEACRSFSELNKLLTSFRTGSAAEEQLLRACKAFCTEYDLSADFWVQFAAVGDVNTVQNSRVHCSVVESVSFLSSVCDQPDAFPEFDDAWAMVEALVNYGGKHAKALDADAEAERRAVAKATAEFKQRRRQKQQPK